MTETPPERAAYERAGTTPVDTARGSSTSYSAQGKDPDAIEQDIRHTRAEMTETFDALGSRFEPDYIKEQAKDALRSTAHDAGSSMLDTIKDNPFPAAVAGLSLAWLMFGGSKNDGRSRTQDREIERYDFEYSRRYRQRPDVRYRDYRRYPAYYAQNDASGDGLTDSARSAAGDAADHVRDAAGNVADRASHVADQAGDRLHSWGDSAADAGHQATNWLERQMHANPLAMGAVTLAAGALVGPAVPGTRAEDEWMGEERDTLVEKAKSAVSEKFEQAKSVATEVADEAKDDAKELAQTAKDEADHKGLTEKPAAITSGGYTASGGSTVSGGSSATGDSMASGSGTAPGGSSATGGPQQPTSNDMSS